MFYFSGYANSDNYVGEQLRFAQLGFPIRKSSDRRLLRTSPKHIVATPRPSSPFDVKASTIRPYDLPFYRKILPTIPMLTFIRASLPLVTNMMQIYQ